MILAFQEYNKIETKMMMDNTGSSDFSCQALLHTYLRVKDISKVKVTGYNGIPVSVDIFHIYRITHKEYHIHLRYMTVY